MWQNTLQKYKIIILLSIWLIIIIITYAHRKLAHHSHFAHIRIEIASSNSIRMLWLLVCAYFLPFRVWIWIRIPIARFQTWSDSKLPRSFRCQQMCGLVRWDSRSLYNNHNTVTHFSGAFDRWEWLRTSDEPIISWIQYLVDQIRQL